MVNMDLNRFDKGVLKGIANAVPDTADALSSLAESAGMYRTSRFLHDGIAEPFRKTMMRPVGNAVKRHFDRNLDFHFNNALSQTGPSNNWDGSPNLDYWNLMKARNVSNAIGDGVASGFSTAASWPIWGDMINGGVKGVGLLGRAGKISPKISRIASSGVDSSLPFFAVVNGLTSGLRSHADSQSELMKAYEPFKWTWRLANTDPSSEDYEHVKKMYEDTYSQEANDTMNASIDYWRDRMRFMDMLDRYGRK